MAGGHLTTQYRLHPEHPLSCSQDPSGLLQQYRSRKETRFNLSSSVAVGGLECFRKRRSPLASAGWTSHRAGGGGLPKAWGSAQQPHPPASWGTSCGPGTPAPSALPLPSHAEDRRERLRFVGKHSDWSTYDGYKRETEVRD